MKKSKALYILFVLIGLLAGFSILFIPAISTSPEQPPGLLYYTFLHFAGYLFFVVSFIEILSVYMIRVGSNPYLIILLSVVSAVAALCVDYWIGRVMSTPVMINLIGEKRYNRLRHRLVKYRDPALFVFNLLPLSSPLLTAVAGILRYDFSRVILVSFLGLFFKYVILASALLFVFS